MTLGYGSFFRSLFRYGSFGSQGSRRPAARRSGFTLIELMVALSLAAMLTLGIMVISNTAREIYIGTTKKVEAANRFKLSLLKADRDFSQWIDTSNLEFFLDGIGAGARINSHWDDGEEFRDEEDALGPGVVDGGVFGEFDEFATITQRQYYGVERGLDPSQASNRKLHNAYQAYFRTMTYVDGEYREANVEYMLLDTAHVDSRGNPLPPKFVHGADMANLVLVKVVRYQVHDYSDIVQRQRTFRVRRRRVEVASNVTDFKIEYAIENRFSNKVRTRFVTPYEDFKKPAEPGTAPRRETDPYNSSLSMYRKIFGYGSTKLDERYAMGTAYIAIRGDRQPKGDHRPVRFGWEQPQDIFFAELVEGSEIFIFTPSSRGIPGGGAAAGGGNRFIKFVTGTYTVKNNLSGRLEFYEDISSITWERDQNGLFYKASFIPTAIRITLRIVDDKGQNPRTFQRVVWIRRKSR